MSSQSDRDDSASSSFTAALSNEDAVLNEKPPDNENQRGSKALETILGCFQGCLVLIVGAVICISCISCIGFLALHPESLITQIYTGVSQVTTLLGFLAFFLAFLIHDLKENMGLGCLLALSCVISMVLTGWFFQDYLGQYVGQGIGWFLFTVAFAVGGALLETIQEKLRIS